MVAVVVRLPDRRVVDRAVRLRDLVVQRAVERRRARACSGRCPGPGSSGAARCRTRRGRRRSCRSSRGASSTYWSSARPGGLAAALRRPSARPGRADLDDGAGAALLAPSPLPLSRLGDGLLAQPALLLLGRVGQVVALRPVRADAGAPRAPCSTCGAAWRWPRACRGLSPVLPPRPGSTARLTSFARFLRQQRSCRVRRSRKSVAGRWPRRRSRGDPGSSWLRDCGCSRPRVHRNGGAGDKSGGPPRGCRFAPLHVLAKRQASQARRASSPRDG